MKGVSGVMTSFLLIHLFSFFMCMKIINRLLALCVVCSIVLTACSNQAEEDKYAGYLFAYFEGSGTPELQEQLRFAVSTDAVHWTALMIISRLLPRIPYPRVEVSEILIS